MTDTQFISFNDFLAEVSIQYENQLRAGGDLRYGQMYFNILHGSRPDIANKIRGTKMDPFFRESVRTEIHQFVESLW